MAMMRQMQRSQLQQNQQQKPRKKTDSIKPTFLRSESSSGNGESGVDHVVLLKLNVLEATKVELRSLRKRAHKLATIDGVASITVGEILNEQDTEPSSLQENVGQGVDNASGYNYYLRVRLKSVDKLKTFQGNPLLKEWHKSIDSIRTAPPLVVSCNAVVMSASSSAMITMDQTSLPQPQQQLQQR